MKQKLLFLIALFGLSAGSLHADPFIVFGPNVKVVFNLAVIDGFTVTEATATVSETAPDGTITSKKQTYAVVPDGSGGFERRVTQEETVATPVDGTPGVFDVETTTEELETPVDEKDVPTGATVTSENRVTEEDVDEVDLDLPPTTTFFPLDPELDTPVVISPA
jgi:hypothetical protein